MDRYIRIVISENIQKSLAVAAWWSYEWVESPRMAVARVLTIQPVSLSRVHSTPLWESVRKWGCPPRIFCWHDPPSIFLPSHRSHITYSAPRSTQAVLGWYGTPNGTPSSTWHATWRATWQPHDTIHDTLHDTTRCGTRNRRQRAQSEHPTYRSTGYLTARPTHFSARSSAAADPPPYTYRNVISA